MPVDWIVSITAGLPKTVFDLDKFDLSAKCPNCGFDSEFTFRQARLRDVLICRGCKANIQLDDQMNQCRKARQQVNEVLANFQESIASLNITFNIKF